MSGPDLAYHLALDLFGPQSPVPWWGWVALLAMLFWRVLFPDQQPDKQRPETPARHSADLVGGGTG